MEKKHPLYIRDNKFTVFVFCFMIFNLFMIFGPVSLYVKQASFSLFFILFFTGFIILTAIKGIDKTKPRFISIEEEDLIFIYWDKHEEIILKKSIKELKISGVMSKNFNGIMTFTQENGQVLKVPVEVFKTAIDVVKTLKEKTKVTYNSENIENAVNFNFENHPYRTFFKNFILVSILLTFFIIGIIVNLNLRVITH